MYSTRFPRTSWSVKRNWLKQTGAILDDSDPIDIVAHQWYVADPSSDRFGKVIPVELLEDIVTLGSHGLVQWDNETEFVRELGTDELQSFLDDRKEAGSDLRTLGDHRDAQGRRYLHFTEGITLMRESKFEDWGFTGPRSVLEYLKSIQAGPGDISSYHLQWLRTSGVAQSSAISHEHRCLCEALRLGLSRDLLDISNLMSFEHLTRRLIILEIAVARNPSLPDFSGLDVVSEAPITSSGSAAVSAMSSWITDKLKERANIQKQSRLFKEEFSKRGKATQDDGDQVGGGGAAIHGGRRRRTRSKEVMEIVAEHQAPRWASDTLALQSLWCAACLGD